MICTGIAEAIESGLEFLTRRQLPSGRFPVEMAYPTPDGMAYRPDESLFAPAQIVYSLGFLPHPPAQAMISRALAYLRREMSESGLWRHWSKTAQHGTRHLNRFIPADMDDTACISYLMRRHGIEMPDNRGLILLNRNRAGLFYTWLMLRPTPTCNLHYWRTMLGEVTLSRFTVFFARTEAGYRDVDGVVNANGLLCLGETAETRPVITWLIGIVESGNEADCDKWYRGPWTFYYALSRNRHAGMLAFDTVKARIVDRIERAAQQDGRIGENALDTALAANTLLNFGVRSPVLERAVGFLLRAQGEAGNWDTAPYYYAGPKKRHNWGAAELTTGLCLEALQRFHG